MGEIGAWLLLSSRAVGHNTAARRIPAADLADRFHILQEERCTMSQIPGPNPAMASAIGSKATTALICSIACWFLCCPLLSIAGLVFAMQAEKMIQQNNVGQEHAGKASIAKIVSIVHLALSALGALIQIGMLAIGGFTQPG